MDFKPLYTTIEKMIQLNNKVIVLESAKGFPYEKSNLYLVDMSGEIVWSAEKPEQGTCYSRVKLNEDGDTFSAYTLSGHACELDLRTGKLISSNRMQ